MRKQAASSIAHGSCLCLSPAEFACRAIRGTLPRWAQPYHELEIERAINNAKRTEWDKWFRREWYKVAARRRWQPLAPPAMPASIKTPHAAHLSTFCDLAVARERRGRQGRIHYMPDRNRF